MDAGTPTEPRDRGHLESSTIDNDDLEDAVVARILDNGFSDFYEVD